jgi:predicted dehydrogenase
MEPKTSGSSVTRREFLGGAAAATAGLTIVPRHVLGGPGHVAPSDKITMGCIGVGAQGTRVMMQFLAQPQIQVVAVCDVNREDSNYSEWGPNEIRNTERRLLQDPNWGAYWEGPTCGRDPAKRLVDAYYSKQSRTMRNGCRTYGDFREMIANEKSLDAVTVCTPDHWHAHVAIHAMQHGKNVYCQKPMTHTIYEARMMAETARQTGVVTQVAVANEASPSTRMLKEWIAAGVIGQVTEVHNWSSRPYWAQGMYSLPRTPDPVPAGLDWDMWLGPAGYRPYSATYQPFIWRGWYDFGNGALGDMGNYSFDTMFRILDLTSPTAIEASFTNPYTDQGPKLSPVAWPVATLIHWDFPARGNMGPVKIHWYDGNLKPMKPTELLAGESMNDPEDGEGMLIVGTEGKILAGFEGQHPKLLPTSRMKEFRPPADNLPKSPGHLLEFINAIHGGEPARANVEFEENVVDAVHLGNIAVRSGTKIGWDPKTLTITNAPAEAAGLVNPPRRAPWTLA